MILTIINKKGGDLFMLVKCIFNNFDFINYYEAQEIEIEISSEKIYIYTNTTHNNYDCIEKSFQDIDELYINEKIIIKNGKIQK